MASLDTYTDSNDVFAADWTVTPVDEEVVGEFTFRFSFDIHASTSETWNVLRDFGLWMDDLEFEEVIGDSEGGTVYFTIAEPYYEQYRENYKAWDFDPKAFRKNLIVRRATGNLIVVEDRSKSPRAIGGYYVLALSEQDGSSTVAGAMGYAPEWASDEAAVRAQLESLADEVPGRWKTLYIPRLRQLVEAGG